MLHIVEDVREVEKKRRKEEKKKRERERERERGRRGQREHDQELERRVQFSKPCPENILVTSQDPGKSSPQTKENRRRRRRRKEEEEEKGDIRKEKKSPSFRALRET